MICGVIPARGGSKGVPRKNVRIFAGKPLIAHTIEAARLARSLDRVIVSTDDDEIAEIARAHGAEVPFMRPRELAGDDIPTLPVLQHAGRWLEQSTGRQLSALVTLQPTSPLRRTHHIDKAVQQWRESGADAVVTVCLAEHHLHWMGTLNGDQFVPLLQSSETYRSRQSLPPIYRLNGAVYVTARRTLLEQNSILGGDTRGLVMTLEESLDIDTIRDFAVGEIAAVEMGLA
jgi:CMP-N,N'-diacetyllegionaminic acid synthase